MAREKSEHCLICGIEKTEDNTYMRLNGLYFQPICKECSSKEAAKKYVQKMSPERKKALIEKHKKFIENMENAE